jgi:co-chaperonin GroES (HSP10)
MLKPAGGQAESVLVRITKETVSAGGIFISPQFESHERIGVVQQIGVRCLADVKVGDRVLIDESFMPFKEENNLIFVKPDQMLGVLEG